MNGWIRTLAFILLLEFFCFYLFVWGVGSWKWIIKWFCVHVQQGTVTGRTVSSLLLVQLPIPVLQKEGLQVKLIGCFPWWAQGICSRAQHTKYDCREEERHSPHCVQPSIASPTRGHAGIPTPQSPWRKSLKSAWCQLFWYRHQYSYSSPGTASNWLPGFWTPTRGSGLEWDK